jgi:hypothetical protein
MTAVTKMVEPFALNAATDGSPGSKTVPFPVPSQIPLGSPGAASLNDGFTPLNMTGLNVGGIPMSGPDLNGILYLMSTTIAALNSGIAFLVYDAGFQTAIGGYPQGAILRQAANPLATWTSSVANNMTDPDTGGAGWVSSATTPLYDSVAPAAGTENNLVLPGPSDYVYDVDTTAGNLTITGMVPQRDGQIMYITNTGANLLTFSSLSGSSAANQFRIPADLSAVQNQTYTFHYSQGAGKWILV